MGQRCSCPVSCACAGTCLPHSEGGAPAVGEGQGLLTGGSSMTKRCQRSGDATVTKVGGLSEWEATELVTGSISVCVPMFLKLTTLPNKGMLW